MFGAEDFMRETDVSRETLALYEQWRVLLVKWNQSINLVQASTLDDFWFRHALDSHQLTHFIPQHAKDCIDLGSGAGFPGLSIAMALKGRDKARITLVESAGKKTSFLRTAIRTLSVPAMATSERAESLTAKPYDLITARAFAPLPKLLTYAERFWGPKTLAILPKGQSAELEIKSAQEQFEFSLEIHPSATDTEAKILVINDLKRIASCAS